jgi:hypothetical protein
MVSTTMSKLHSFVKQAQGVLGVKNLRECEIKGRFTPRPLIEQTKDSSNLIGSNESLSIGPSY